MKLRNLLLGAALSLPMLAVADNTTTSGNPFAGAFAGLGVGYTEVDRKLTDSDAGVVFDTGKGGFAGQVLGGYNFALGSNWLVGAEVYYGANNDKVVVEARNYGTISKIKSNYGIDALLGYTLSPTAMVFGGLGWAQGKSTTTFVDSVTDEKTVNGVKGLVGLQENLTNAVSLRQSISYISFSAIKSPSGVVSIKPTTFTGMFSLVYTFNV